MIQALKRGLESCATNSATMNGRLSRQCCRTSRGAYHGWTIGGSSMASSGSCGQERRGAICLVTLVHTPLAAVRPADHRGAFCSHRVNRAGCVGSCRVTPARTQWMISPRRLVAAAELGAPHPHQHELAPKCASVGTGALCCRSSARPASDDRPCGARFRARTIRPAADRDV